MADGRWLFLSSANLTEYAFAIPLSKTVEELEAIRNHLLSPPTVGRSFSTTVDRCSPDDSIDTVTQKMFQTNFSQLPVYCDNNMVALLTTDTIARWLSTSLKVGGGLVEGKPIHEVLSHAEYSDNYQLLAPNDTVFDAISCFGDYYRRGRRLDAVIITQGRSKKNLPLGIITMFDVPKLYESLQ